MMYTHRVAYETFNGPLVAGRQVDHLCRNPRCCNPDHLDLTSARTNGMRGQGLIARHSAKTHCPAGHPYDEANTYRPPRGGRMCRICVREKKKARPRPPSRFGVGGQWKTTLTHCLRGHEFTTENTYVAKNGTRCCRACHREREHRRKKRDCR